LTEPLVPADVDLRGYEFMPLYGDRLFGSETWIGVSGEAKLAALRLWWRCYAKEVPASSLPDSDALLADYAGYGSQIKPWRRVKTEAMRGFVLCTDGRWYHRFIAELALEAWKGRQQHQLRTLKARIAAMKKRLAEAVTDHDKQHITSLLQDLERSLSQTLLQTSVTDPVTRSQRRGEERTGRGQDELKALNPTPLSGSPPDAPQPEPPKRVNGSAYYADAESVLAYLNKTTSKGFEFRNRSGELTTNADRIIQRLKQGYTPEELREVVHA
jgi:hypothetical protein